MLCGVVCVVLVYVVAFAVIALVFELWCFVVFCGALFGLLFLCSVLRVYVFVVLRVC